MWVGWMCKAIKSCQTQPSVRLELGWGSRNFHIWFTSILNLISCMRSSFLSFNLRFRSYFRVALCCFPYSAISRHSGRFSQYSGIHRSSLIPSPLATRMVLTRSSTTRGRKVITCNMEGGGEQAETQFMRAVVWWRQGVFSTWCYQDYLYCCLIIEIYLILLSQPNLNSTLTVVGCDVNMTLHNQPFWDQEHLNCALIYVCRFTINKSCVTNCSSLEQAWQPSICGFPLAHMRYFIRRQLPCNRN